MKKSLFWQLCVVALFCFKFSASTASQALNISENLSTSDLTAMQVENLLDKTFAIMASDYIDVSAVPMIEKTIRQRYSLGQYANINSIQNFAKVIGSDIQRVSGDVHLSIQVQDPNRKPSHVLQHTPGRLTYNYAFETVSYLHGNIGYLKFNKFDSASNAKIAVDDAFGFLRNSAALILDMRDTVGGSPELAQYILSYFIEPNIPLWRVEARDSELQSHVASLNTAKHRHFLDNFPVWVLTSNNTASASEIFIGVLQAQQKATVVGDITAGAGFYVGVLSITDELTFRISLAKPVIAVSNINWEKTGLQPDIRVISMDALDTALQDIHQFRRSNQTEAHN